MRNDLARALGLAATDDRLAGLISDAEDLVDTAIAGGPPIPTALRERAVVEVAAGLAQRMADQSGTSQYVDPTKRGGWMRGARDPLATVRPLLAPYTLPGIA